MKILNFLNTASYDRLYTCTKEDVSSLMNKSDVGVLISVFEGHCQTVCGVSLFALNIMNISLQ